MSQAPGRFPFSAVVGHDDVKLALILNALDPRIGGVLLRGQKGSAKTTLARGLAALLGGGAPFVELPVGATEDRVVGSLDLQAALTGGRRRLQPGLLHAAHGGVLYVDEVNLLPDHLVDVLLDVAASGVNRVEREGISETHPSRFLLVGSMNPEEGDLRPQLLDRFGLSVDVASSTDPHQRAEAVRRRLDFDSGVAGWTERWNDADAALSGRLAGCRPAAVDHDLLVVISRLCASVGAEGLRADLVLCRAAAALAGWEGRAQAGIEDVRKVAPFVLAHRRRRSPLEDPGIDQAEIDSALEEAAGAGGHGASGAAEAETGGARQQHDGTAAGGQDAAGGRHESADSGDGGEGQGAAPPAPAGEPRRVVAFQAPRSPSGAPSGRRTPVEGARGRLIGDRAPEGPINSLAVGATVRAAAQRRGVEGEASPPLSEGDLREAVRRHKAGNLLVLAVDASGSMGARQRMEAVKGAVLGLLVDAYQRRDRVALVTFRGEGATVALRPTSSIEVARARLGELPTGGRTPLASGILQALRVAGSSGSGHQPIIVVISDGKATFAADGSEPLACALDAAGQVRRSKVASVVIDAEDGAVRLGLAAKLADAMGARYMSLPELSAGALGATLRGVTGPGWQG